MNTGSKEVSLDEVEPGMELARDLLDRHGTVLLQKGSLLSPTMLAALERRGVTRLRVLGEPDDGGIARAAERARLEARLAHLFRHRQDTAASRLRARLLAYRLESP